MGKPIPIRSTFDKPYKFHSSSLVLGLGLLVAVGKVCLEVVFPVIEIERLINVN